MSKLQLNLASLAGQVLSRSELKNVTGGVDDDSAAGCSGTTESTCSGKCKLSNGNDGTCGWTRPTSKCTCAGLGN